jgi:hypothetical protein
VTTEDVESCNDADDAVNDVDRTLDANADDAEAAVSAELKPRSADRKGDNALSASEAQTKPMWAVCDQAGDGKAARPGGARAAAPRVDEETHTQHEDETGKTQREHLREPHMENVVRVTLNAVEIAAVLAKDARLFAMQASPGERKAKPTAPSVSGADDGPGTVKSARPFVSVAEDGPAAAKRARPSVSATDDAPGAARKRPRVA